MNANPERVCEIFTESKSQGLYNFSKTRKTKLSFGNIGETDQLYYSDFSVVGFVCRVADWMNSAVNSHHLLR